MNHLLGRDEVARCKRPRRPLDTDCLPIRAQGANIPTKARSTTRPTNKSAVYNSNSDQKFFPLSLTSANVVEQVSITICKRIK